MAGMQKCCQHDEYYTTHVTLSMTEKYYHKYYSYSSVKLFRLTEHEGYEFLVVLMLTVIYVTCVARYFLLPD